MGHGNISGAQYLAEGWARKHTKEFIQFLYIAMGSLAELETIVIIAIELGYLKEDSCVLIKKKIVELQKMMHATIKTLSTRLN